MRIQNRLILAFLSAALASCSGVVTPEDHCSVESYMPLRTGNWWVYEGEERDSDGNVKRMFIDSVTVRGTLPSPAGDAYELLVIRRFNDGNPDYTFSHLATRNGQSVDLAQLRSNHVATTRYWDMLSEDCSCEPLPGRALDCSETWRAIDTIVPGDTLPTIAPDNTIGSTITASRVRHLATKYSIPTPTEFDNLGIESEALHVEMQGLDSLYVVKPLDAKLDPQYGSGAMYIRTSRDFTRNTGLLQEEISFHQGWQDGSRTFLGSMRKRLVRFSIRTTP